MIMCPKCNKELSDGSKFCDGCGTAIPEMIFCPNCGKQTSADSAFCQNCGAAINGAPAQAPAAAAPAEAAPVQAPVAPAPVEAPAAVFAEPPVVAMPAEKKKIPTKALIYGGIGVAVVVLLIVIISLVAGGKKSSGSNYALYMKDKEIYFTNFKKEGAWQLTSRFVNSGSTDNEDLADSANGIGSFTYVSENGKYIFFPDKIDTYSDGISLYYKELSKPGSEAVKIDSDITSYTVNKASNLVTYLKGYRSGDLYQYKIGGDSKDKIAGEVEGYEVSDDGKKIVYLNSEGSVYVKYADKDKEKIVGDVRSVEYVTEDLSTIYYIKDDALYKQVEGADKVKIASDVYHVLATYDTGEIYYLVSEDGEVSLMDYVIDDMKSTDDSITEPETPKYPDAPKSPSRSNFDSTEEYQAAVKEYNEATKKYKEEKQRLDNEYNEARQAYREKQSRDQMRESLKESTLSQTSYVLHYFNGTDDTVVTDSYTSVKSVALDAAVIAYQAYDPSRVNKVKLSEISRISEVRNAVSSELASSSAMYVAAKNSAPVSVESKTEIKGLSLSPDGTAIYYIDDIPEEKNYGDLYRISVSDGTVGKPESFDSDVYSGYFLSNGEYVYYKDYSNGKGDLYINKNKIDYDVSGGAYATDDNKVYYYTDRNDSKRIGTLKVYNGKESVKIADDVFDYIVTADGRVLYLHDYSRTYYRGELMEWSNGKTQKLDDDVVCVLDISDGRYRGRNMRF